MLLKDILPHYTTSDSFRLTVRFFPPFSLVGCWRRKSTLMSWASSNLTTAWRSETGKTNDLFLIFSNPLSSSLPPQIVKSAKPWHASIDVVNVDPALSNNINSLFKLHDKWNLFLLYFTYRIINVQKQICMRHTTLGPQYLCSTRVQPIVIFWLLGRYLIPGIPKMSNIRPKPNNT